MAISESIKQAFENVPYHVSVEDFLPELLRQHLPAGIDVATRQEVDVTFPFVLVRDAPSMREYLRPREGVDVVGGEVHIFTEGVDAESEGMMLAWTIWGLLEQFARENTPTDGSHRSFVRWVEMVDRPQRRPDWADSTGPVQYQDLPQGVERHRLHFALTLHHFW